jgi:hypothetical protein
MKSALVIARNTSFGLIALAALAAGLTMLLALYFPGDGVHINIFDAEYDSASLASVGFIEWMAVYCATTIAYIVAGIGIFFAIAITVAGVTLMLVIVAVALLVAAIAILSPIIAMAALVWVTVWGVRRLRARNQDRQERQDRAQAGHAMG